MKNKILKIVIYCFFLFILFEGSARLFISIDPLFEQIRIEHDSYQRIHWIKTHQNQVVDYSFDNYDPSKGWILKPNERSVNLNTNSKRLRGKIEYSYQKPADKIRILIIGDSFTFGSEVSDHETYPYYLQQMLPEAEVINMGVWGYGHDQMLIYLKEEGIKYNPDIVILGFMYDDVYRNVLEFRDYAKPKFEIVNNRLQLKNSPVPPPDVILEQEFYRLKILDLLAILFQKLIPGPNKEKAEKITALILDEMLDTINRVGATPLFVYLPYGDELDSVDEAMTPREDYFFGYCQTRGIWCVSLRPYFIAEKKKGARLERIVHWNPVGNLVAACGIRNSLFNDGTSQQAQAYECIPEQIYEVSFKQKLHLVNPTDNCNVYTYIWNNYQTETYLLDASSRRGRSYDVEWVITPKQIIWFRGKFQEKHSSIIALSPDSHLAVAVAFSDEPDYTTQHIFERRYWFRFTKDEQIEFFSPPEEWHNPRWPEESSWQMKDIDSVMTDR